MNPLLFLAALAAPPDLHDVTEAMRFPGVTLDYHWDACGEVNAYYDPQLKSITLCTELLTATSPAFIRFALAHEAAHAVIHQLDVPFTGSEEVAADELAAVVFGVQGWADDVLAAAVLYGSKSNIWVPPWDPHPEYSRRAVTLLCLAAESEARYPVFCDSRAYLRALRTWLRLLHLDT